MLLVGVERFNSKTGVPITICHCMSDEIDSKKGNGTSVEKVSAFDKNVPDTWIGKDINVVYGRGFDGKAFVKEINLIT